MVKLLIAVSQCVNKQMEYNKAENSKRKSAGVDAITFFFLSVWGWGTISHLSFTLFSVKSRSKMISRANYIFSQLKVRYLRVEAMHSTSFSLRVIL